MECSLCHGPFLPGDEQVNVVLAITGTGVATGEAHRWCADALKSPTPVAS